MSKLIYCCCVLFIFSSFSIFSQEKESIFSIYFKSEKIAGAKKLANIDPLYFGKFELEESKENALRNAAGDVLIVDNSGVYLEKNKLLSISRTEVRENSKYIVKDGYLFGIIENDSLPVALENDAYYFLIPAKTYLYATDDKKSSLHNGLQKGEYIVLTKEENSYYSALYIEFSGSTIALKELELNAEDFDLRKTKSIKEIKAETLTYTIDPDKNEWPSIMKCFSTYDLYLQK